MGRGGTLFKGVFMKAKLLFFFFLCLFLFSCASIAPYSTTAYRQAVELKVDALELMSHATSQYVISIPKIYEVTRRVEIAHEFAKGRRKNEISTKQWAIMRDPDRHLLGGFLKRWEEKKVLSRVFVLESMRVVSDAFDTIIGLESRKIKMRDK
jgi:hypothetical protein